MLEEKIKKIKMLAMDVDGTLTDGSIYIADDGEAMKCFHVKDGLGISLLHQTGIITAIVTGRTSKIVMERAKELKINEVVQGAAYKNEALEQLAEKYLITLEEIAYIGDDLNDLPALAISGLAACPADADSIVKQKCDVVLEHNGGSGAVRELAEMIMKHQRTFEEAFHKTYLLKQ